MTVNKFNKMKYDSNLFHINIILKVLWYLILSFGLSQSLYIQKKISITEMDIENLLWVLESPNVTLCHFCMSTFNIQITNTKRVMFVDFDWCDKNIWSVVIYIVVNNHLELQKLWVAYKFKWKGQLIVLFYIKICCWKWLKEIHTW